jgi:hypothetical protein
MKLTGSLIRSREVCITGFVFGILRPRARPSPYVADAERDPDHNGGTGARQVFLGA